MVYTTTRILQVYYIHDICTTPTAISRVGKDNVMIHTNMRNAEAVKQPTQWYH